MKSQSAAKSFYNRLEIYWNNKLAHAEVSSVKRKYFYVTPSWSSPSDAIKFERETGKATALAEHNCGYRIWLSEEHYRLHALRTDMLKDIAQFFGAIGKPMVNNITDEELQTIIRIIKKAQKEEESVHG